MTRPLSRRMECWKGVWAPLGHVVGVGAAVEGEEEAFFVVPVGFAGGKPGEGTLVAAAEWMRISTTVLS